MSRIQARIPLARPSAGRLTVGPVIQVAVVAVATLLAACAEQSAPLAPHSVPDSPVLAKGGNGGGGSLPPKIAFVSGQAGTWVGAIRTMNADGTGIMNLTSGADNSPAWSPDYRKLAFVRQESDGAYINVVSASGGQPKRLVRGYTPRWSPDGSKIAFARFDGGGAGGIFVMSANGKNIAQLTTTLTGSDFYPSWSPDGTKMTFVSNRTGTHEIYVMNADGTGEDRLTDCALEGAHCSAPSWGPVAGDDRIVYWATLDPATQTQTSIRQLRTGGGNLTIATGTRFGRPAWSPDGSRILFSKEVTPGNSEVFRIDFSGIELEQLTQNFLWDFDVAWTR